MIKKTKLSHFIAGSSFTTEVQKSPSDPCGLGTHAVCEEQKNENHEIMTMSNNLLVSITDSRACTTVRDVSIEDVAAWVCYSVITVGHNSGGYAARRADNGGFVAP